LLFLSADGNPALPDNCQKLGEVFLHRQTKACSNPYHINCTKCPSDSSYSCVTCPRTCDDVTVSTKCPKKCWWTCLCQDGMYMQVRYC